MLNWIQRLGKGRIILAKISVIVPVYNVEKYLNRCIDSILNQTYKDFELIFVDDGSSDNSGAICDEYANKDNRIKVIHKENGGVSTARNAGLDIAQGEYIMFVDSDDFLTVDCLEILIKATDESVDLVAGGYVTINFKPLKNKLVSKAKFLKDAIVDAEGFIANVTDEIINSNDGSVFLVPWGKLYKTTLLHENNIRYITGVKHSEDTMFNFEFYSYVKKAAFVKECIYNYDRTVFGAASCGYEDDQIENSLLLIKKYKEWLGKLGDKYNWEKYCTLKLHETLEHFLYFCNICKASRKIRQAYDNYKSEYKEVIDDNIICNMFGDRYKTLVKNREWTRFVLLWKSEHMYINVKKRLARIMLKLFMK